MEAKQPSWKHNKKRIASRNIQDGSDDTMEGSSAISRVPAAGSSGEDGLLTPEMGPKKEKLYIYVGAPLRDQLPDGPPEIEIVQSREKLEELAKEELKRKHDEQSKLPHNK